MDNHSGLITRSLDLHFGDSGMIELLLDHLANFDVLMEQLGVVFPRVPPGTPGAGVAQPVPHRMCFLSHSLPAGLRSPPPIVHFLGAALGPAPTTVLCLARLGIALPRP